MRRMMMLAALAALMATPAPAEERVYDFMVGDHYLTVGVTPETGTREALYSVVSGEIQDVEGLGRTFADALADFGRKLKATGPLNDPAVDKMVRNGFVETTLASYTVEGTGADAVHTFTEHETPGVTYTAPAWAIGEDAGLEPRAHVLLCWVPGADETQRLVVADPYYLFGDAVLDSCP